jgi:hypothetical protein
VNEAASQTASASSDAARRLAFRAGIGLFVLWLCGLTWLVFNTSNPVTLNVVQLQQSDCVVVADLTDPERGEFRRVTKIIGNEIPETFRVLQFPALSGPEAARWLMALHREREGEYSVVPVPYRDTELLLVYPGDEGTIAQARDLLDLD